MYKKIIASALFTLMLSFTSIINAETVGYEAVTPAQPTKSTDKIEVIEFFWYGCPHCYSFEPLLSKWAKTLPKNVEFIRQPAVFSELWGKHAKAYFTAEALGVVDKVHSDLFDAVQAKQSLETEDELAKFFVAHGVKESDFRTNYNSFLVDAKMRQAKTMAARYGVNGVPAIIVNGKYRTNGTLAGSQEKMIDVINQLIKQESSAK
ncbi:MAG: thiol:disulfide interchange protein DsbA/DsbL [Methylococcaceae bacterium]|nr:thiol:disulfide interchange protein DsbA/DsbL [Methylococcaceae bacterium]MDZ4157858.1 thiol:disulfide interchange protein DsbA/DsbL [Methylococcales bacterium]MDP2392363.1 thiol:disulfide interchange protein DsbA/DsbL [Methylococcaceae bacterium]MDP3021257.1 thiol:disulfide interchange protein DsbA/DsbL [Methylococcaceae bacterium]MDP3390841.1 thiol:disulfide interchange protein DsbA/DsbL [Methylococcaceae bacterium]